MRTCILAVGVLAVVLTDVAGVSGQTSALEDAPKPYPVQPMTRKEWGQRESLKQYVLGALCEHDDRLLEALKAYEEAARLDPEAAAVVRSQIPLLMALDRRLDALAAADKVVALDPDDFQTWFIKGRMHKLSAQLPEAKAAFQSGLKAAGLKDRPELEQEMHLDLGALHESAGDLPLAIAAFTEAAKILDHPDVLLEHGPFKRDAILGRAADTYERIGNLHRKLKQFAPAIEAYKKAQERLPERAGRLNFNLAQLSQEQGKLDQALQFLDAYLRLQPLGSEAYDMKIALLEKTQKTADILPWLERAATTDPNNSSLKSLLAKEYIRAKQFAAAEKIFQALIDQSPAPEAYRGLFRLFKDDPARGSLHTLRLVDKAFDEAKNGKGPPGVASLQARAMLQALREDGDLARDVIHVAFLKADREDLKFETLHLLAMLADKHRQVEEAEKFYRKSLTKAAPATEALVYGGLLRTLWKAHKHQDIVAVCEDGLKRAQATNRILFLNDKAKALARLGKMAEAVKAADDAVNFAGDNDKLAVRSTRVRVLVMAEKFAEAEAECQAMFKDYVLPGETMEVRYLLSNVYSVQKKMTKAEEQLELILKADPNNITVNNDLGYLWADQNKHLDKAEAMIRRAIELDRQQRKLTRALSSEEDKDNAAYIDSLGWVLFRQGKFKEAREQLELAVTLPGGDDATLWDHLGDALYRLQMVKEARNAWQRSLQLFEQEKLRRLDERHHEVQRKLKLTERAQQ